mmetsp:Transcript_22641/g.70877  ORF Transcript_22641/g.70877 Transcript_22641/m.70877 type:complete len:374 (+) Transcript_22641:1469-2590(+)
MSLEDAAQRLLEDGLRERLGHRDEAAGLVDDAAHLVEADLVQGAGEDVDDVGRRRRASRELLVKLLRGLEARGGAFLYVGVRPHVLLGPRLLDDQAGTARRGAADHEHDASALPRDGRLEESYRDREGGPRAAERPLVRGRRPGVALEVVEHALEAEGALGDGEEEAADGAVLLELGLSGGRRAGRASRAAARRGADVEELLDALDRVVLRAAEGDGLVTLGEAEFVDHNVGPKGDEAHEGVLGQQVQRLLDRVLQLVELRVRQAGVEDEDEDRRRDGASLLELVLDRGELRNELGRQICLRDVLSVVGREVVPAQAERTGPQLRPVVHLTVRIQQGAAAVASNRVVRQGRRVRDRLERGVQAANRDDDPRCL